MESDLNQDKTTDDNYQKLISRCFLFTKIKIISEKKSVSVKGSDLEDL